VEHGPLPRLPHDQQVIFFLVSPTGLDWIGLGLDDDDDKEKKAFVVD
jgi:hypothetical protein